tara:strand:- start:1004 stop:1717 length:714 start_codon:yes stop_codon:yes gene_type:complete
MQSIPKKIKGFTILEVVIVLSLVGIISAIGIPKFNSWNKDRVVRAEAERVRDIVTSITSQVQRGLYGFGQFQVEKDKESNVSFSTNGMLMANIATRVFTGTELCRTGEEGVDYWDHFGVNKQNVEVRFYKTNEIKVDVSNGVVCFSKDGSLFSGGIDFGDNADVVETIFICSRDIETCEDPELDLANTEDEELGGTEEEQETEKDTNPPVIYVVSWSRFGNVKLEKWYSKSSQWIVQ